MSMGLAVRFARRELRGGLRGFWIFLACLALGVAAIAAVGTVRAAILSGLTEQGAVLLGGDAQMEFTYRFASDEERTFMIAKALAVSEVVDFRSMAIVGEDSALTQVKAVDAAYPLTGDVRLEGAETLAAALAPQNGLPGAVMDPVLADRLGLKQGDSFALGAQRFHLGGRLLREPDSVTGGFALGPRTIVRTADLAQSGLIAPGTLYETKYRMRLAPGTDLSALKAASEAAFRDTGMRWADSRKAAPGIERFVDRIGAFLILVGLAGMAVGGVGVSAAVRSYLEGKIATIATLKTLGAEGSTIFQTYLFQIGFLSFIGILAGLVLGVGVPLLAAPWIEASLPFPADLALSPRAMAEAGYYGLITALLFTLWPLARTKSVRAAALYRGAGGAVWPGSGYALAMVLMLVLLIGGAVLFSGTARLTLYSAAGVMAALAVLALAAAGMRRLARFMARGRVTEGRVGLRAALAAIGGPRTEATSVILSLGLGLSVLAAVGQIDANLRAAIDRDLPAKAPSFFFIDIQKDQIAPFLARMKGDASVSEVESAPMLRGVITRINGRPAVEVAGHHWVLDGDRGITFAAIPPEGTKITAGAWWPADYKGPPQISFAEQEATELGLKLGDELTVNILGRDIEAEISSFRVVDFSNAGMGFVMAMDPAAVEGAPHTYIATVYSTPASEATLLRDITKTSPNITAIRVRDAIDRVTEALAAIATATAWAAGATLLTGAMVLIGAAAAGERARVYEAALLKVLGATRAQILGSFALRAAIMGAAAGGVAVLAGGLSGWAVMRFVMEAPYRFEPVSALLIVAGGVVLTLLSGLLFALRPLSLRPAGVLRDQE
ncbi:MAG: FtsX-like permease family protein [Cypionkella sp.]